MELTGRPQSATLLMNHHLRLVFNRVSTNTPFWAFSWAFEGDTKSTHNKPFATQNDQSDARLQTGCLHLNIPTDIQTVNDGLLFHVFSLSFVYPSPSSASC